MARKFRELREDYFTQGYSRVGPLSQDNSYDTPDVALFDPTHPKTIDRINGYIHAAFGNRQFIDIEWVLQQIQRKLAILGYQFNIPKRREIQVKNDTRFPTIVKETIEEFPISYLGGRYGVLDNKYTVGHDDNIRHKVGYGLKLVVRYHKSDTTGLNIVNAAVEKSF